MMETKKFVCLKCYRTFNVVFEEKDFEQVKKDLHCPYCLAKESKRVTDISSWEEYRKTYPLFPRYPDITGWTRYNPENHKTEEEQIEEAKSQRKRQRKREKRIRTFVFALPIIFSLLLIATSIANAWWHYTYDRDIGNYLKLADDSSTASKKLEYLTKYSEEISKRLQEEDLRLIFVTPRHTKTTQLEVLGSLIQRLEEASKMAPDTMQYQQAMLQITGQEFDHTLDEINSILRWGLFIQQRTPLLYHSLFIMLWLILDFLAVILLFNCIENK